MKFNTKLLEGEWFEYKNKKEKLDFLIRPFPNSKHPFKVTGDLTVGDYNWTVFRECVLDWKGVEDKDGKELVCNISNKLILFDLDSKLFDFVSEKQNELRNRQEVEIKN